MRYPPRTGNHRTSLNRPSRGIGRVGTAGSRRRGAPAAGGQNRWALSAACSRPVVPTPTHCRGYCRRDAAAPLWTWGRSRRPERRRAVSLRVRAARRTPRRRAARARRGAARHGREEPRRDGGPGAGRRQPAADAEPASAPCVEALPRRPPSPRHRASSPAPAPRPWLRPPASSAWERDSSIAGPRPRPRAICPGVDRRRGRDRCPVPPSRPHRGARPSGRLSRVVEGLSEKGRQIGGRRTLGRCCDRA